MTGIEGYDETAPPVSGDPDVAGERWDFVSLQASAWSAPLPAPDDFQRYEDILPGTANRILELVEKQQNHQHTQERTVLEQARLLLDMDQKVANGDSRRAYLGIFAGLSLSLVTIGGGIYLISNGHDWAGLTLAGINLTGLAGVFVYGVRIRHAERRRNAEPA